MMIAGLKTRDINQRVSNMNEMTRILLITTSHQIIFQHSLHNQMTTFLIINNKTFKDIHLCNKRIMHSNLLNKFNLLKKTSLKIHMIILTESKISQLQSSNKLKRQ